MTHALLLFLLAAPQGTELERRAVGLYKEGEAAYRAGDFDAAIQAFRAADAIAPSPEYDFNIAQAYRKKGDCEKALISYRNYVRLKPSAIEVKMVREQLAEMEACVKGHQSGEPPVLPVQPVLPVVVPEPAPAVVEKPAPVEEPAPTPPVEVMPAAIKLAPPSCVSHPMPESTRRFTVPAVVLGAGGLLVGAIGAGFWNSALGDYNRYASTCGTACNPMDTSASSRNQSIGIGLFTSGAVLLAAGLVFLLMDSM